MTKLTNYLATVTDVNSVFATNGPAVPDSERCVIKDETGQTAGSVGALNHWQIDPTADPLVTYTNNRLPRWQDLVPLTKYTYLRYDTSGCSSFNPINVYSYVYYPNGYYYLDGGTTLYYLSNFSHTDYTIYFTSASVGTCIPLLNCSLVDILSSNAIESYFGFRLYQSTVGVASYNNYIIISATNTARHILSNQTSATTSYMIAGYATSYSPSGFVGFFRYGINIYKLKQDYPAINTFTFDLYGARLYDAIVSFTVRNSIKTGFLIDQAPNNGVDFSSSTTETVFSDYTTTMCQPLNTYVKIGYFTLDTLANTFAYTNIQGSSCTTTTTSTTSTSTSTTTTTTTCNPTPNWQNTGFSCYGGCNKYNVQTDQNPCSPTYNTTRQGSLVESNSTYCGGCCGQSTAANWVNNGAQFCSGCTLYQPERDSNGCSPTYNQTRNVNLGISNNCGSWDTGYYCSGCALYSRQINSCTGEVRNVTLVSSNSDDCGTWNTSYYCEGCAYYSKQTNTCTGNVRNITLISGSSTNCGGCCGQSSAANWVNSGSYNCYGSCTKYNVEVDNNGCSPTYNQTRQGSAVEYNSSYCGGCCGATPSANWVNNGGTFCDGCYLQQPQIDNNPCSSTYGQTRNVDLGVNTSCGYWLQSYYCVGYNKWTKETNSCTGNIRNNYEVQANSPYCGYVPPPTCRTYQIIGYNSDEYVSGIYTNCSGFGDSFSFYGGPGTVGYICAQPSSVYITSGNGAANDVGSC